VDRADHPDIEVDRRLGDELLKGEWFEHAAFHYHRFLSRRPDDGRALINYGTALVSGTGDRSKEGIPALERGLALTPDSGFGHLMLAVALFNARRDIPAIIGHSRRAVSLMPSDPEAHLMLGRGLVAAGHLKEGEQAVSRALELNPNDADARELLQKIRAVIGAS
jgi:tetratricopeptide (TPR) repeat protein